MPSLTEVLGTNRKIPQPDELTESASNHLQQIRGADGDMTKETASSTNVVVYKTAKDGRFLVKHGEIAIVMHGSEAEHYAPINMNCKLESMDKPLFNTLELEKGRLVELPEEELPAGLKRAIDKDLNEFEDYANKLLDFVTGG